VGAEGRGDTLISALRLSSFEDPGFIHYSFHYRNGTFCSISVQFETEKNNIFVISKTKERLNLVVFESGGCLLHKKKTFFFILFKLHVDQKKVIHH
jgi:hypothetical protein